MSPGPKANPLSPEVRPMQVWELGILKRGRKWHLSVLCLLCQKKENLRSLSDNKRDPQNRAQDWEKPRFLLKWKLSICDLFLKQHVRVRKLVTLQDICKHREGVIPFPRLRGDSNKLRTYLAMDATYSLLCRAPGRTDHTLTRQQQFPILRPN